MNMIYWDLKLNYLDVVIVSYFFNNTFQMTTIRLMKYFVTIFWYPNKMIHYAKNVVGISTKFHAVDIAY